MVRLHRGWAAAVVAAGVALAGTPAGAAPYDGSNPSSTGCITNGVVEAPSTVKVVGAWEVRIRRSTGCNTAWGVVRRTDGKRCKAGGQYCAKVRITRVRSTGVKNATNWRKMTGGTSSQYSLQLGNVASSTYTATAATFGGKQLAVSGPLTVDAAGNWRG
jgi:hypothetical protein